MSFRLNSDKTVAVATDYYWEDIDENTPRGVKIQLLTRWGIAIYGVWHNTVEQRRNYVSWAPMPKRRPHGEDLPGPRP